MKILKSFFRFTSRERLAILLLCLLMVVFWALPLFFPEKPPKITLAQSKVSQPNDARSNSFAYGDAAPESKLTGSMVTRPDSKAYSDKASKRIAHYFPFNPNTISADQWRELGLRDKTIITIQHYLQKGGQFKKPEDLRKIWGLQPAEADLLIPYVQIPAPIAEGKKPQEAKLAVPVNDSAKLKPRKNWNLRPIDINTAGPEQWMAFPGIGEVLANRIVKFRDKMGGFSSIEQVGKTYGIKDSLFQLMKPLLILKQAPAKKD